jgi:DNA-binding NarL/FixJ family response regulator
MGRYECSKTEYERILDECGLTDSEKKVLALKRRGWANADVAAQLNFSLRTINRRTSAIRRKANI